ncbi:GIY-YIG nuclease family protein [Leptolyngbya sp. CCY15150]|uniref:GIY-YIG nuclease family protein n=1 Tax=Leptolyngbya sp. CCY15150 TaxID=2767772 RepID=UPI001950C542|nr:GIY-YIG nuclease family protein [Leptolyngbya sp. CCY15150]
MMNAPDSETQISLFSADHLRTFQRPTLVEPSLEMSHDALVHWIEAIAAFQRTVTITPPLQQTSLFDAAAEPILDAEGIDPFQLPRQNAEFWRWKSDDAGVAALYFVIDCTVPLLLYVGETVKSNQRWKGLHDCKRYLMNYRQIHQRHQRPSSLNIAFWRDAPVDTRQRQRLESALIHKWRSPFNKENWRFWGTPFTTGS